MVMVCAQRDTVPALRRLVSCSSSAASPVCSWTGLRVFDGGPVRPGLANAHYCARQAFDAFVCGLPRWRGAKLQPPDWAFGSEPATAGKFVARWAMSLFLGSVAKQPGRYSLPTPELTGWLWRPPGSCAASNGTAEAWLRADVCRTRARAPRGLELALERSSVGQQLLRQVPSPPPPASPMPSPSPPSPPPPAPPPSPLPPSPPPPSPPGARQQQRAVGGEDRRALDGDRRRWHHGGRAVVGGAARATHALSTWPVRPRGSRGPALCRGATLAPCWRRRQPQRRRGGGDRGDRGDLGDRRRRGVVEHCRAHPARRRVRAVGNPPPKASTFSHSATATHTHPATPDS